jgi:hypothetical protein
MQRQDWRVRLPRGEEKPSRNRYWTKECQCAEKESWHSILNRQLDGCIEMAGFGDKTSSLLVLLLRASALARVGCSQAELCQTSLRS